MPKTKQRKETTPKSTKSLKGEEPGTPITTPTSDQKDQEDKSSAINNNNNNISNDKPAQEELQCGICLDIVQIRGILDACRHPYCYDCIMEWSKTANTCPFCKGRFKSLTRVDLSAPKKRTKKVKIDHKDQNPEYSDPENWIEWDDEWDEDDEGFDFAMDPAAAFFQFFMDGGPFFMEGMFSYPTWYYDSDEDMSDSSEDIDGIDDLDSSSDEDMINLNVPIMLTVQEQVAPPPPSRTPRNQSTNNLSNIRTSTRQSSSRSGTRQATTRGTTTSSSSRTSQRTSSHRNSSTRQRSHAQSSTSRRTRNSSSTTRSVRRRPN